MLMIRFTQTDASSPWTTPEAIWPPVSDALLPWADPYIARLVQELEEEAQDLFEASLDEEQADGEDEEWQAPPRKSMVH
jgi:hypothetical protein